MANSKTIRFIIRYRTRHKKTRNEVYLKSVLISPDTCQTWVLLNLPKHERLDVFILHEVKNVEIS